MRKTIFLLIIFILSMAVLLAGCGNNTRPGSEHESSYSSQVEPTVSLEATSSSEMDDSVLDPVISERFAAPSFSAMRESQTAENENDEEVNSKMTMNVQVGSRTFTSTLEENAAVFALVEMMKQKPVTIQMSDYSGFEKVGPLGVNLPVSDQYITAQTGDIVLYQGNQIVMFYGSNSWSYTRLGHIEDLAEWEDSLGSGDVTVTFSLEN